MASCLASSLKMFVELEVTETEPGFKGDTVQGSTKPAHACETGAEVKVPHVR